MAADGNRPEPNGGGSLPQQAAQPPSVLADIISPALQVGGVTGVSGLLAGAVGGVLRSTTPTLFALASGLQWFTLGTTFWAARGVILSKRGSASSEPGDKVAASAIAGGISGGIGGLLRSRRNVIPGTVMFALFGAVGQGVYNLADARGAGAGAGKRSSWMDSRWSPVKVLSDDEYEDILQEKLLRINVEIAVLDDSIEETKARITAPPVTAPPATAVGRDGK